MDKPSRAENVADSIRKARASGFPMTIEAAEYALLLTLTDAEREVVEGLL